LTDHHRWNNWRISIRVYPDSDWCLLYPVCEVGDYEQHRCDYVSHHAGQKNRYNGRQPGRKAVVPGLCDAVEAGGGVASQEDLQDYHVHKGEHANGEQKDGDDNVDPDIDGLSYVSAEDVNQDTGGGGQQL